MGLLRRDVDEWLMDSVGGSVRDLPGRWQFRLVLPGLAVLGRIGKFPGPKRTRVLATFLKALSAKALIRFRAD